MEKKIKYVVVAVCIISFLVNAIFTYADPVKWWDETIYSNLGYNLLKYGEYSFAHDFADRTYGWPNAGYRPPLLPLLCSFVYIFFGDNLFFLNLIVPIFGALGVLAVFLIGKEVWNEKVGIYAAILLCFLPIYIEISSKILTDTVSVTLTSFAILFFIKGYYTDCRNNFKILFAIFLALAFLARYSVIYIIPLFFFFLFLKERKEMFKDTYSYIALGTFLLLLSAWLLYSYFTYGNIFGFLVHSYNSVRVDVWGGLAPKGFFVSYWFLIVNLLIYPFFIGVFFIIKNIYKTKLKENNSILGTFLLFIVIIFFISMSTIPHKETRYALPLLPSFCLIAALPFTKMKKLGSVLFALFAYVLVYYSILNFMSFSQHAYTQENICFLKVTEVIKETNSSIIFNDNSSPIYFYSRKTIIHIPDSLSEMLKIAESEKKKAYYLYSPADNIDYRKDMKSMNKPLVFSCSGYELYRVT